MTAMTDATGTTERVTGATDRASGPTLEPELEAIRRRSASLPWYRRPRRLRRQVAGTLVVTALVAVGLFGGLSYYASDQLLRRGADEQLNSVAETRAVRIEAGANRVLAQVASLASDLGIARALIEFEAALDGVDDELSDDQQAELDRFYTEQVVGPVNDAGLATITIDDVEPRTAAGRWVQYHHVLPDAESSTDTSGYAEVLSANDEFLQAIADTAGASDLLLVSLENETVVYSTSRNIDLATSLADGPHDASVMARLVRDDLGRVRAGEGVLSSYEIYLPNRAEPSLFAAAAVRDGSRVVGAVVLQIPALAIDAITTGNFDWERLGLGAGESYVVSSDLVLQSVSRPWLDDPERYLELVEDSEERRLIELFGSPVGVHTVDTEPVRAALRGEQFTGRTTNYLGQGTYSASTLIDVPGVQWVVVTDIPVADARKPVDSFVGRMLVVAAIVVPLAALIGAAIARRLARPIGPAVSAAQAVAEGERRVDADSLRGDEFGDLGRRLSRMAAALESQEASLSAEYERKRDMMRAVLPAHVVGDDGAVVDDGAVIDTATAISVALDTDDLGLDTDELAELVNELTTGAQELVEVHGLQRIRVAADRGLYVAGIGDGDDGVATAVRFIEDMWRRLDRLAATSGVTANVHIGVSTGALATSVLSSSSLTFGAWGEPVRRALAISALSSGSAALLDASTHSQLPADVTVVPAEGIVDLDGQSMEVYSLERRGSDPASDSESNSNADSDPESADTD